MGVLAVLTLGLGACHKADPVGDLEKAAAAMEASESLVRIPMHHGTDSLNISHALAIAMAATSLPPT